MGNNPPVNTVQKVQIKKHQQFQFIKEKDAYEWVGKVVQKKMSVEEKQEYIRNQKIKVNKQKEEKELQYLQKLQELQNQEEAESNEEPFQFEEQSHKEDLHSQNQINLERNKEEELDNESQESSQNQKYTVKAKNKKHKTLKSKVQKQNSFDSNQQIKKSKIKVKSSLKEEIKKKIQAQREAITKEYQIQKQKLEKAQNSIDQTSIVTVESRNLVMKVNEKFKQQKQKLLRNIHEIFHNFDDIYSMDPKNTTHLCSELLGEPTQEQIKESNLLQEQLQNNVRNKSQNEVGDNIIMLALKKDYEEGGVQFLFSRKSTAKTQLCAKILTSAFMEDITVYTEHLKKSEWSFDDIYYDKTKRQQFISSYKKEKAKQYNIEEDNILVTQLIEGSIKVRWILIDQADAENINQRNRVRKELQLHPYFSHFALSPQDFDPKGNIQFRNNPPLNDRRGKHPYYPPVYCKRYGINVSKKYDNKCDDWLMMDGRPGEWAVVFHGVTSPSEKRDNVRNLNSIMSGREKGQMLKPGWRNLYKDHYCVNKPNEKVNKGVYCSPHFQVCKQYANSLQVLGKKYRLVLQCRVNPEKIKICDKKEIYWVINESKDIRPYGILLIKQQNISKIKNPSQIFGKQFKYEDYKDEINK